jgi:Na+-transporting NADH:ubiquinone oxidoreductase subunit A
MREIKVGKGLNLPISGQPRQEIEASREVQHVAIIGDDFPMLKPKMLVKEGDQVKQGQAVISDKTYPDIVFAAPAAGKVVAINRGAKRHFLSLVIAVSGEEHETFKKFSANDLSRISSEEVKQNLLQSGAWTMLRSRPGGRLADPQTEPAALFINAMDTNPLAADMGVVLAEKKEQLRTGIQVLAQLTNGPVYFCQAPGPALTDAQVDNLEIVAFRGPHPAGLTGTHIHFLAPASRQRLLWHIDAQDVAAIGELFLNGFMPMGKVIALAGPGVKKPRLLQTRQGACLSELLADELNSGDQRIISGSVYAGKQAADALDYLGRYDQQVVVLAEGRQRKLLGWALPPLKTFSVKNLAPIRFGGDYEFNTDTNGGERPIVPVGSYEEVMPLDIIPTYLLRAIAVDDVEEAEALGCLELIEEDLGLCAYVCPSKIDHAANLRRTLTLIEKEG